MASGIGAASGIIGIGPLSGAACTGMHQHKSQGGTGIDLTSDRLESSTLQAGFSHFLGSRFPIPVGFLAGLPRFWHRESMKRNPDSASILDSASMPASQAGPALPALRRRTPGRTVHTPQQLHTRPRGRPSTLRLYQRAGPSSRSPFDRAAAAENMHRPADRVYG